ncbi:MAG TPA: DUF4375 domain-containing protein, partial [Myxococcales bacterium]|nr:DUF4375 domain-containing protein [Myxococcales bacterium]
MAVEAMPERHPPRAPKSLDEIFRLSGNEFQSALLERVAIKAARVGHTGLSGSEAVLLDVSSIEGEVFNGGFDQYFFNSSGDRAREALAGLELIGAKRTASVVRRAVGLFGPMGPSRERSARWQQMD